MSTRSGLHFRDNEIENTPRDLILQLQEQIKNLTNEVAALKVSKITTSEMPRVTDEHVGASQSNPPRMVIPPPRVTPEPDLLDDDLFYESGDYYHLPRRQIRSIGPRSGAYPLQGEGGRLQYGYDAPYWARNPYQREPPRIPAPRQPYRQDRYPEPRPRRYERETGDARRLEHDSDADLTRRVKVDPPTFDGRLDPKVFADWVIDMDQFFDWQSMSDLNRV
ncbi:hypothetical protein AXF42_Ash012618 [Apostasia shenzhenica]|uniref:Uncharacterized protein n=1 Tax=Apostasia shenzhenica TaxID=1088818 RepID=A0A2H9ZT66_9ASPA|nr:hypothetical protein AXF42_Ash012618 [Apostasia shenzhenica]